MEIIRIAKCLSGEITACKRISSGIFIDFLENELWIFDSDIDFNYYKALSKNDLTNFYFNILSSIEELTDGENKIQQIIHKYKLPTVLIDWKKRTEANMKITIWEELENLWDVKKDLSDRMKEEIKRLKTLKWVKYNKEKGNDFEKLCEEFLLHTSFFWSWLTGEMEFEDETEKIDRLLRLKSDICNFNKKIENKLGYVILEAKFKVEDENSAMEVSQLSSYIRRLRKYGVSRYAVVITSTNFKKTYKTKLWNEIFDLVKETEPFYTAIITTDEILKFLNPDNKMSFDEFIERQFIKWLK